MVWRIAVSFVVVIAICEHRPHVASFVCVSVLVCVCVCVCAPHIPSQLRSIVGCARTASDRRVICYFSRSDFVLFSPFFVFFFVEFILNNPCVECTERARLSQRNCTNSGPTIFSAALFSGLPLVFYDLFTINFSFSFPYFFIFFEPENVFHMVDYVCTYVRLIHVPR